MPFTIRAEKNTAYVNDMGACPGQQVQDLIHFGQCYESKMRLMKAIALLC